MSLIQVMISLCWSASVCALIGYFWPNNPVPMPTGGERGQKRQDSLRASSYFRIIEPIIRGMSLRIGSWNIPSLRARINDKLDRAGLPLGMTHNEFIALSLLVATAATLAAGLFLQSKALPFWGALLVGAAGLWLPTHKLEATAKLRRIIASRNLPNAIDLIALAMKAGLDFTGAMMRVSEGLSRQDPLRFELEHILQKMALGWSRQAALRNLSERIPTPSVQSFVSAVIQAERRGNPLAQVLSTQASVLRLRRSQAAEEAAARAGILILGPLMLIFVCVFLVLLGPFAVSALRGEIL